MIAGLELLLKIPDSFVPQQNIGEPHDAILFAQFWTSAYKIQQLFLTQRDLNCFEITHIIGTWMLEI